LCHDDQPLERLAVNWRAPAGRGDRNAFGIAHALEVEAAPAPPARASAPAPLVKFWQSGFVNGPGFPPAQHAKAIWWAISFAEVAGFKASRSAINLRNQQTANWSSGSDVAYPHKLALRSLLKCDSQQQ